MLITLLAAGSRGDTQPYIALGVALKHAGHAVRLATFQNYRSFVLQHGLDFYPIRGDISAAALSATGQAAMQAENPLKVALSFHKLKALADGLHQDFFAACAGSDAVIYHPGAAIGYFAARQMGIPAIFAPPFPMTPTRAFPALIFYNGPRLGRTYNYLTHKLFEQIMWAASGSSIRQFWKQTFGRPPADFGCPFPRQVARNAPTIISCSDTIFPRPPDWPEHIHNTGYWYLEDTAGWDPPADLLDFLNSGRPPVFVGFGSMGNPRLAGQTTQQVIRALDQAGQRGVLATGWSGLAKTGNLPKDIYILESAPHSWLFPRMAAVVHHGGAGTTAAGLQAGVPAVIVPHANDQFAWALRLYELGAAARPLPRKILSADGLAHAILQALSPETKEKAAIMGQKIRAERGAETAARIIQQCFE